MTFPRPAVLAATLILSTVTAAGAAPAARPTPSSTLARTAAPAAPAVRWREWDNGLSEATQSGKPVLVDVYTDWCGWCKRMERDVYSDARVRGYLDQHFVVVKLNAEAPNEVHYQTRAIAMSGIAEGFRVTGYPTTVFLRPSGDHLLNVPGYVPADKFLLVLRFIGDGAMERGVSFADFEKSAGR